MRILVIPDIHDKIDIARRIIDNVPHDRRVLQGDAFDDFPTGAASAKKTAIFMRECLRDPDTDVVLGNHDISYGWGMSNHDFICSGFTKAKHAAIHQELSWSDWRLFKLHVWVPGPERPWLLTHAGFDHHFWPEEVPLMETINGRLEFALRSLHSPIPCERGRGHAILRAGHDRGGEQLKGGVLWCDWSSLNPPPGINQLVGHTPNHCVRQLDSDDATAVCLDTGLLHYGILDDGVLTVEETASVPYLT